MVPDIFDKFTCLDDNGFMREAVSSLVSVLAKAIASCVSSPSSTCF